MTKQKTINQLRGLLQNMFDTKYLGAKVREHSMAQGLSDGYMQALIDLNVLSNHELVQVVHEERREAAARADINAMYGSSSTASPSNRAALDFA
jgi:hypothetical protein